MAGLLLVISGYFPRARGTSPHWFGQSWQPREVVGDEAEGEDRLDLVKAARFRPPTILLQPKISSIRLRQIMLIA
jgi:hypothetical protein